MEAIAELEVNKSLLKRLLNFYQSDVKLIRTLLLVAGLSYLSSGYTFYSQGLTTTALFYQNIFIGVSTISVVLLSFIIKYIKDHLQQVIVLTVYAIMIQSTMECADNNFEPDHVIALFITLMACSLAFKKAWHLNIFIIFNIVLIITVSNSVETKIDSEVLAVLFLIGGGIQILAFGSRLRSQEKLRKSEDLFKNIFNESADANFLMTMDSSKVLSCNNKAVQMFEAESKEELIGINPYSMQKEQFTGTEFQKIQKQIQDNWGWSKEMQYITRKGKTFWGNLEFRVVQFNNKPHLQIRITDISERKRLEHMLLAEKQVLELASRDTNINNALNLLLKNIEIISGDMKTAILFFNEDKTELCYSNAYGLPEDFRKSVGCLRVNEGSCQAGTAAMRKKPIITDNIETSSYWKDYLVFARRHKIGASASFPVLAESTGEVLGIFDVYFESAKEPSEKDWEIISRAVNIVGVLVEKDRAVTENKLSLERIKIKNEELTKTNQELDRFVYSTSHDLRAPLMNVLGLIDITEMNVKEEEPKSYLTMMKKSVQGLDDTIKEILEYSKNARTEVEAEQIDLHALTEQVFAELQFMEGADSMEKRMHFDIQIPFYSDKSRLTVILNNLVSNAIKYRNKKEPNRFVAINTTVTAEKAIINISDNGIGIKPEYQEKVFDMFFRGTTQGSGSGLGLYILKETLNKLKGKITVSSALNRGTMWVIEIPNMQAV